MTEASAGPALEIGDAGAKGRGVFAARIIESGELVWDYGGEERWINDIPAEVWQYCFQVDYDRYVLPERGSPGWFMNHSCEPNCVIMGRTRIVALRRISRGEEVTFDYSTNVGWDGFSMECKCGSGSCRKVVGSYSRLPEEVKGRYGACVSGFLLRPASRSPRKAARAASSRSRG
ncbi:MAG TPA: SET domain-containing protein-lysine N-methyltransferase [Nitrososphaerales archaeon]|nr:SET domain-containing protein-lysine N-methyltransferase [Nitrososphaerales archaeon]